MDAATPTKGRPSRHRRTAFYAFALAAFSCVLGLSFCLLKSPQSRSQAYLAAAVEAMDNSRPEQAAAAALQAVRLNPMTPEGWHLLSQMLQQKGDEGAAAQARSIAARVQQNPRDAAPVYAMPAEFKLSLLALAETQTP
jgi:cytochrome c-type biogenesis protein CcmH/NrfG